MPTRLSSEPCEAQQCTRRLGHNGLRLFGKYYSHYKQAAMAKRRIDEPATDSLKIEMLAGQTIL